MSELTRKTRRRTRPIIYRLIIALFALALVVAACDTGGDDVAVDDTDDADVTDPDDGVDGEEEDYLEQLHQEALDEGGEVVLYTHMTPPDPREAINRGFEEAFPGMRVEATAGTGPVILERLLSEKRAGVDEVDVFKYPGLHPFLFELEEEGFIEEYVPTSADLYPEGTFVEGRTYPWTTYHMSACYNPNEVTDEEIELLQSYEGWTDPTWHGRAAITGPLSGATSARGLHVWVYEDPDLGEDWLRAMAEHDATVYPDVNAAVERVIAGEHAVAFNNLSAMAGRQAEFGAPLRCTFGEYVPTISAGISVVSDAPNPAGAKLFVEWMLSEEGQIVGQQAGKTTSARAGMEAHPVVEEPWWELPTNLWPVDEPSVAENLDDLIDLFQQLFNPVVESD